jgi:hypothetical protein
MWSLHAFASLHQGVVHVGDPPVIAVPDQHERLLGAPDHRFALATNVVSSVIRDDRSAPAMMTRGSRNLPRVNVASSSVDEMRKKDLFLASSRLSGVSPTNRLHHILVNSTADRRGPNSSCLL